jgi:hypothetical protein
MAPEMAQNQEQTILVKKNYTPYHGPTTVAFGVLINYIRARSTVAVSYNV